MVAPIIVSVFKGRFWCGNLCLRGNFYDNVINYYELKIYSKKSLHIHFKCSNCNSIIDIGR
jgi:hypothetical protein